MRTEIIPVSPDVRHELFEGFHNALNDPSNQGGEIRGAFAYATSDGVRNLIDRLSSGSGWNSASKRLLVGVHNAITEPAAMRELRKIEQAEIRTFVPGGKLTPRALAMAPVFHPKVLALMSSRGLVAIQAGSPNLSKAAIGQKPTNYEFALSLSAINASPLDTGGEFDNWWTNIWNRSRVTDNKFIQQYAKLRQHLLDKNPILRTITEVPETVRDAQHFFLEVGAGSGPPHKRHQVEFPESLAEFFGEVSHSRRDLTLRHQGRAWNGRPLSHKQTSFGVHIWRLGMPTPTKGGPSIPERAIRFTRTQDPATFDFDVADVGSTCFNTWKDSANSYGHIGATHGQRSRTYGFY